MPDSSEKITGAGGTSGGIGHFFLGLALLAVGLYLFLSRVVVVSNFGTLFGFSSFGAALLPMILGIALLFYNAKSIAGWVLSVGSFAFMVIGIIMNLSAFFLPTNLPVTLMMLGLIGAGAGTMVRSFRPR